MANRTVLIVDDEDLVRWSIGERLRTDGYDVRQARSVGEALSQAEAGIDAALIDYRLPDGDGMAVLKRLRDLDPDLPVVMLTANKSVPLVVSAIKAGAFDYITKPFDVDDVALRVDRALESTRLRRELRRLRLTASRPYDLSSIIGESEPMLRAKALIRRVAASPSSTVLITGESGTGKDLVAKVIHYCSARADRPFVNITCSALPETLLEAELFGYERGAFTDARQQKRGLVEQADGGTVFLDEIGEMTPALQAKVLRFLEDKAFRRVGGAADIHVDVRVVAATNRRLEDLIEEQRFREDLFYRLNVLRCELPPLRLRGDDVLLLAQYLIEGFVADFKRGRRTLSRASEDVLRNHPWPGNVRELRNVLERAVLLSENEVLEPEDFSGLRVVRRIDDEHAVVRLPEEGISLEDVERQLVRQALERTKGNQTRAAMLLGLHRDQIRYRMEKFGLMGVA